MHDDIITAGGAAGTPNGNAPRARRAPVSVVVPCYRCTKTIDDAVASIARQTLLPAEVLLVEDGSGDGTLAALRKLAAAHEEGWIKVIALEENGGPSRARNIGWQEARQPYIAFLDADDCWAPRKLELQMQAIDADPSLALVAHRMVVSARGAPIPEPQGPVQTHIVRRGRMLFHNPFPTASVLLRRDIPFRFDENVWHSEDYLLWSQILFSGRRCAKIDALLAVWNQRAPGERGLSDDFMAIHHARRLMRRRLMREGFINGPEYLYATTLSVLADLRRKLKFALRSRKPTAYRPQPG